MPVRKLEGIQIYMSGKRLMPVWKWEGIEIYLSGKRFVPIGNGKGFRYTCLERGSCLLEMGRDSNIPIRKEVRACLEIGRIQIYLS